MSDCIFCRIVAGEIPADIVYEDDDVLAFEDANPVAPVHTLIIPKQHYEHIGDEVPSELLGKIFSTVKKVAELKGVAESGYRTVANTGSDGRQTVFHLHVHVIGGMRLPISLSPED